MSIDMSDESHGLLFLVTLFCDAKPVFGDEFMVGMEKRTNAKGAQNTCGCVCESRYKND